MKRHFNFCPRCGVKLPDHPAALSRVDNVTEICSDCGTDEAMQDYVKYRTACGTDERGGFHTSAEIEAMRVFGPWGEVKYRTAKPTLK